MPFFSIFILFYFYSWIFLNLPKIYIKIFYLSNKLMNILDILFNPNIKMEWYDVCMFVCLLVGWKEEEAYFKLKRTSNAWLRICNIHKNNFYSSNKIIITVQGREEKNLDSFPRITKRKIIRLKPVSLATRGRSPELSTFKGII